MKTTKILFVFLLSLAISYQIHSQQVVSSAGGYYQNENISLSWTLGEPVIETFSNPTITLTQGFQQPYSFYLSQILNIPAGWSGVSAYIDPLNKGVENLFDDYLPDFIILASMSDFYFPAGGVNTIVNWNYQNGYKIKAANNFELTLTGNKINDPTVNLEEGWNLIPVLSACETGTNALFDGLSEIIVVKAVAGTEIYWPQYGIETLDALLPGKAYMVLVSDAVNFTYPECSTKSSVNVLHNESTENRTFWNDVDHTSASHAIAFPHEVLVASGLQLGDFIGAFTPEGRCSGMVEVSNLNSGLALLAFANDETSMTKDGFENGEMLQFKVFRPGANEEIELNVQFDESLPNLGVFANEGLSAVKSADLLAPAIGEIHEMQSVLYPNPSKGAFTLTLNHWPENFEIQITDARGGMIDNFKPIGIADGAALQMDFRYLPKGMYIMKLMTSEMVQMKKFIIN